MHRFDEDFHRFATRDFNKDFDAHFARTERTINKIGVFTVIMVLLQIVLYLAISAVIVYFIVFAIIHWLRW